MKIKDEKLPTRCEICHQSDKFNAFDNNCSRCSKCSTKDFVDPFVKIRLLWIRLTFKYLGMILGGLLGVLGPDCGTRYLFLTPVQVFIQRSFRMLVFSLLFMFLGSVIGTKIGEVFRQLFLFIEKFFSNLFSKK
jgi:hypothetical protein